MVAADDSGRNYAQRLGIHQDQIVQELGWDQDSDDDIRADVEGKRAAASRSTRTLTRWSTSCCGGATTTVTWWIG